MSLNEDIADMLTGHRLALLRYEGGTTKALLTAYDAAFKDITTQIAAINARPGPVDLATRNRLQAKANRLTNEIRDLNRLLALTLDERATEAAYAEAAFQARLSRVVGQSWVAIPEDQVLAALSTPIGGTSHSAIATDLLAAHDGLQGAIARALAQGASMDRAALMVASTGIIETYRGRLVAIARTEIQRVANEVAMRSYADNDDVVKAVQWLATLDSRTCPICAALHNKVYPIVGRTPVGMRRLPPAHPRCRCFIAPVTKSWKDLGLSTRDDERDGQPAGDMSFDAWLRRQPKETQNDILGPTRADLWRGRRVSLAGFSDQGRLLNLGELRSRYAQLQT